MKSENAKKYIDKDAVIMNNGDRMVDASTAYTAIDIAEQEAEERIRAELLRWHDPKEELPEEGAVVLGEIANEGIAYYAIIHYDIFGWWIRPTPMESWASCPYDVIKWRYIYE